MSFPFPAHEAKRMSDDKVQSQIDIMMRRLQKAIEDTCASHPSARQTSLWIEYTDEETQKRITQLLREKGYECRFVTDENNLGYPMYSLHVSWH